jgi:hypothetical protein
MSYTGIIKIPVLFDMSGDTIVYGEDVTGDFVTSHLDFILDMTTEANDISLNAADISSAILVGDQDNTDNLFYSGGADGNVAVDNLCNRLSKAITRGKLVHIPKAGNHSNSGIPLGGRAELVDSTGTHTVYHIQNVYTDKYFTSVAPIGDEQMLGEAMARVASIHLVGTPLAAAAFEDQNSIQTYLQTASTQTFNSGNTAFYNALAVQLSKVLGGSKSSAPMNKGTAIIAGGNLASQIYYESFDNEDATLESTHDVAYITGRYGGKALSTIGNSPSGFQWVQRTSNSTLPASVKSVSFHIKIPSLQNSKAIFDNRSDAGAESGDNQGGMMWLYSGALRYYSNTRDTYGTASGSGFLPTGDQIYFYVDGVGPQLYQTTTNGGNGTRFLNIITSGTEAGKINICDGNWHHFYIEYPDGETPISQFKWLSLYQGGFNLEAAIDEVRFFNAALTTTQIQSLADGNSGAAATSSYPLDASGTSVPALKSIYEQLMSVPGRSQIMQTRDISGVVDNSNVTLAGGFPFIAGDKLVMYLRPKIVFAAQTKAEQSTSLITFSDGITLNTPVFNVGRDGQGITGQAYSHSTVYSATYGADKAFDGTVSGGYGYIGGANFDNNTGAYNKNPADNTSVDGANLDGEWIQVNVGKKVAVTSYKIYPQNWEQHSIGGRSPHIFKLVYSDDGTNFLTADSQTVGTDNLDTSEWASDNTNSATYIPKTFTLTETKIGQYWRLIITSLYGNAHSNGGTACIQELEIKGSDDYTEPGGSSGMDLSGVQTNIVATAENIEDAFPGNATTGPEPEMNKWGWMGSPNSDSLTLESTDVTDIRTIDLHIWKITITL